MKLFVCLLNQKTNHNRYDAEHRKETRLNNSIKKKEK